MYGIYFSFRRADIRPESERVLREIAGVMTANPDWHILQLRPFNLIGSHASGQLPAGPQGSPNLLERLRQAIEETP